VSASDYLVPDLLEPGLKLVFCGTAPSRASAAARAYYAKPGNRFWPTLHTVGLTPHRFPPQDYPHLIALGIGLTDLCKVHAGVDAELPQDAFDLAAFRRKMRRAQPQMIAFTSKNAAQSFIGAPVAYGELDQRLGQSRLFVLPSPSGLATRFFDIAVWHDLANAFRRL
jgi:double-stranded uracil-DNA glycosylase